MTDFVTSHNDPTATPHYDHHPTAHEYDLNEYLRARRIAPVPMERIEELNPKAPGQVVVRPSDRISFATYFLPAGMTQAIRLISRQPDGVACRVSIQNSSALSNGIAYVSDSPDNFGVVTTAAAAGSVFPQYAQAFPLWPPDSGGGIVDPFVINTKHELWLIGNATVIACVAVMVETYDLR